MQEHRVVESALDRLAAAIPSARIDAQIIDEISVLIRDHYRREEPFLDRLRMHEPDLAAKLAEQHAEGLEIASRLQESLAIAGSADVPYLARRLLAIAQHNMIEEERDVFPLARQFFEEFGTTHRD